MSESTPLTPDAVVSLQPVSAETVRAVCALSDTLSPAQKKVVAPNAISIAEAYFTPEAWFRAIYAGTTPVGFVMLYIGNEDSDEKDEHAIYLWRYMIAGPYQGMGFGLQALELIIEHCKGLGAQALLLSFCEGEASPEAFYCKLGFERDGKKYDDEVGMRLAL